MGCKVFLLFLDISKSQKHDVSVHSTALNYNHNEKITRCLRGVERTIFKRNLKHEKPMIQRQQMVNNASKTLIKEGNLQNIKSNDVFRKCRSEMLSKLDRDKDDLIDLIKFQRNNFSYVKMITQPLGIHIYSEKQLEILNLAIQKNNEIRVHLDATGSIIRKPTTCTKKIYYYSIVIKCTGTSSIFPVLEMISCNHDATTIGIWLAKFKSYVIFKKKVATV